MRRRRSIRAFAGFGVVVIVAGSALLACQPTAADVAPPPTSGDAGACAACHMQDFRSAANHVGKRPPTCPICHTQDRWQEAHLVHPFPLTGAHDGEKCFECHEGTPPVFEGTKQACVDCHRANYEKGPNHVAWHFPTTCADCHSTVAWKPQLPGAAAKVKPPPPPPPPPATDSAAASGKPPPNTRKPAPYVKPPKPPDVLTGPSRH